MQLFKMMLLYLFGRMFRIHVLEKQFEEPYG